MIYFDAENQQVKQFSVDSRGRTTEATWEADGIKAICRTKMINEYGEATDVGIAYSKVDSKTMKVEVYTVENGQLSWDPVFELNFTKQQKKQ